MFIKIICLKDLCSIGIIFLYLNNLPVRDVDVDGTRKLEFKDWFKAFGATDSSLPVFGLGNDNRELAPRTKAGLPFFYQVN